MYGLPFSAGVTAAIFAAIIEPKSDHYYKHSHPKIKTEIQYHQNKTSHLYFIRVHCYHHMGGFIIYFIVSVLRILVIKLLWPIAQEHLMVSIEYQY